MARVTQSSPNPVWRRWFRRTNVYIAEYILMLLLVGSFLGILSSLWFSFFSMIQGGGYGAVTGAVAQMGSLLVVGPAAFWLYSRVTGQEMIQPELERKTSRTVFLTIWMVLAVLSLLGLTVATVSAAFAALFGFSGDFGPVLVGMVLPGLLSAATVVFGLFMVVKHTTRKFVLLSAMVLAAVAVVLLVANVTAVAVNKDATGDAYKTVEGSSKTDTSGSACTLSKYVAEDCTYSEYLEDNGSRSSRNDPQSSMYDMYGR